MKQFKDVKVGNRMYVVTIKDSIIQKDSVGNVVVDYYVSGTRNNLYSDKIDITLQKMYYKTGEGYVKEDRKEYSLLEETITFDKNTDVYEYVTKEETNNFEIDINLVIIAPTKNAITEKLLSISKKATAKISKMEEILKLEKNKETNIRFALGLLLPSLRKNEEKEYTLEEIASMAM